jgi:hypothetical protein
MRVWEEKTRTVIVDGRKLQFTRSADNERLRIVADGISLTKAEVKEACEAMLMDAAQLRETKRA